jgi:hypothetical protein
MEIIIEAGKTFGNLFYTSQLKIEIEALIKDFKEQNSPQKTIPIKFDKAKFQVIDLTPEIQGEIGFTAILKRINGILADKSSGYYSSDIKIDLKTK